jgi:hypothetical protein
MQTIVTHSGKGSFRNGVLSALSLLLLLLIAAGCGSDDDSDSGSALACPISVADADCDRSLRPFVFVHGTLGSGDNFAHVARLALPLIMFQ